MKIQNKIQEVPADAHPRERLMGYGPKSLATHELLAIVLRTGTVRENVIQVASRCMNHFEDLNGLKNASLSELQEIKGIGPTKAIEIQAAIELGYRINASNISKLGNVSSTTTAGEWLLREMQGLHQEHLAVLFLNSKNEIIRFKTIFIGTVNSSVAHPREIFKEACKYPTAHLILAHNHPSGDTSPSPADCYFTRRMIQCGEMMGIEVLDHLIIGDNKYLSLRESTDIFD